MTSAAQHLSISSSAFPFHRKRSRFCRLPFSSTVLTLAALTFPSSHYPVVGDLTAATVLTNITNAGVTPEDGFIAGDEIVVSWEYAVAEGEMIPFKIDLCYCGDDGSSCSGDSTLCGSEYESLLSHNNGDFLDRNRKYSGVIPEGTETGQYVIKVALASDIFVCSDPFDISSNTNAQPTLTAESPDYVVVGAAFTASWVYDNGKGDSAGRFDIDIYSCADNVCDDGCTTFSRSLCSECYDTGIGEYDVLIPDNQAVGPYKVQVRNTDDNTTDCSDDLFYVIEDESFVPTAPPGQSPFGSPAPTLSPTPSFDIVFSEAPGGVPAPTPSQMDTSPGSPGYPPNPVPAMGNCDMDAELSFAYSTEDTKLSLVTVAHASGDRSEAGCVTLTKLWTWLSAGDYADLLYPVDDNTGIGSTDLSPTGTWLLSTSVAVTNGVTFQIMGTTNDGGDCDELKISSTRKKWYRIMGYGGNIDIHDTLIRSWDVTKSKEHIFKDGADGTEPRSFISCVSEVADDDTCDGSAQKDMGECRMDIANSEIGYLGYDDTESYGLTWKVRGLCVDLSNLDLFDRVRVYGDLKDSVVHHLWYGQYSFGHLGGVWSNNMLRDNWVYGFDPHDDSDYCTIEGNTVYNNGNHGIIASKRCDHLLVKDNESYDNGGSGIMLHKSCDDSIVSGNTCKNNVDAGLSLVETSRTDVTANTFSSNRWGFRVTLGSTNNTFKQNSLIMNNNSDIYAYYGSADEEVEVAPFTGINVNNVFHENKVEHHVAKVVDIETSDSTVITENKFERVDEDVPGFMKFDEATNTQVVDNTGDAASGDDDVVTNSCFTEDSDRQPVCA